ncbi:unnamed protein product [Cercospora beticola]|nr:unnamed protein product [Cercospora beticola]
MSRSDKRRGCTSAKQVIGDRFINRTHFDVQTYTRIYRLCSPPFMRLREARKKRQKEDNRCQKPPNIPSHTSPNHHSSHVISVIVFRNILLSVLERGGTKVIEMISRTIGKNAVSQRTVPEVEKTFQRTLQQKPSHDT